MIPGTSNGFSIHNLLSGLLDFEPKNGNAGAPLLRLFAVKSAA